MMEKPGVTPKRAIIIYWTAGGNTEKVAQAIRRGLHSAELQPEIKKIAEASNLELYDYDLVCLGAPSYSWLPPEPVMRWLKEQQTKHSQRGDIKPRSPKLLGKSALVFVTFAGPHTGVDEGIPAGEYLGQFLAHIGYNVLDKWYIVGEFHNREDLSTLGLMGDIRGRPNAGDLAKVERDAAAIARQL